MNRYLVLAVLAVAMVARGEAQTTTELPCGSPPDGTIPGVPVSNVHEPLPGDNVCRGTQFEQVQEIIWICDTLLCCQEPCICDAGHHSEQDHGCGELQPIANISCYVQQPQPIRWYSRVCCEGYEEDDNRMCIPTIDCGAPGGSICEQLCIVDGGEHRCACRDGNQLVNRTHCPASTPTTPQYTTSTTTVSTTTTVLPTTPSSTTQTTTTTDAPVPSIAPTTAEFTDNPVLVPQGGGPNEEPVVYDDGANHRNIILGIVIPLILLLLLLLLICLCCRGCLCRKKPPATPRESVDAAFTNQTYGVLAAQEAVSDRVLIIPDTPEKKKLPLDDIAFENDGYMAAVPYGNKPPAYSEKDQMVSPGYCGPDPEYFNEKIPIGRNGAPVVTLHNMKCPLPEVSASPLREKGPAISGTDFISIPLTAVPNEYMEIPDVRPRGQPMANVAGEQNEVNEIHENIYFEIPGSKNT